MGNRAVVTFDKKPSQNSFGVYLHWNGGPESVVAFAEACEHYAVRDASDSTYQAARFVQIVANFFGGTTSIGCGTLRQLDCTNGDNGVFRVERNGSGLKVWQSKSGKMDDWIELDLAEIHKHPYFKPDEDGDTLPSQIYKKNDAAFAERD